MQATFFTLGWIAQRYPKLVRAIVDGGYELASHGYGHERVSDLSERQFLTIFTAPRACFTDIGGVEVQGYRAPSFSIGSQKFVGALIPCSVQVIAIVPASTPFSMIIMVCRMRRFAYEARDGLMEVPPTTMRMFNRNLVEWWWVFPFATLCLVALDAAPGQ